MGYQVLNINSETPHSGIRYLFDTNIWLAILDTNFHHHSYEKYIKFFNAILADKQLIDTKIVMPGILLSEIINKLMKTIYYEEYLLSHPLPASNKQNPFKTHYRPSTQYAIDYENVCALIRDYHSKLEFISDCLSDYTCRTLIKKLPTHMEFNDYLLCKIAERHNCTVITNDADLKYEGITVITGQKKLLDLIPDYSSSTSNVN